MHESEKMRKWGPMVIHVTPTEPVKSISEHDRQVIVVQRWGLAEAGSKGSGGQAIMCPSLWRFCVHIGWTHFEK